MNTEIENRNSFFQRLDGRMSEADIALVEFAYDLSKEVHRTQRRSRGERYFEHPRAGCIIMMDELGIYDRDLIISFLLHDAGEDTPILGNRNASYKTFRATAISRLTIMFGDHVADMVVRLTKPSVDNLQFFTKEESYNYYIEEMKKCNRTIFLKMIDRLHNLRSIPQGKSNWIRNQINETESVYMPIFASVDSKEGKLLFTKIEVQLQTLKASLND